MMDSNGFPFFETEAEASARTKARDSLFLQARMAVAGHAAPLSVRVRNLSAGGMLAETLAVLAEGAAVIVELPNIGTVSGSIVWVRDGKFGVAFATAIDPQAARRKVKTKTEIPMVVSGLGHGKYSPRRR